MHLRALLQQSKEPIIAPGVYSGLTAKLACSHGFKAIYASGGAIARSTGRPDIGLLSMTEVVHRLNEICAAANGVPVIADADTGFGNEVNVARTVKEYEKVGVHALHIEDQVFPKRCGHLAGKTLIPTDEMVIKLKAAVRAKTNPDTMIIARTDAIAVHGIDDAIERAKKYMDAGADMIFIEAPTNDAELERIATEINPHHPSLLNLFYGGKTPLIPMEKVKALGYNLVIIPSDLQRAEIYSVNETLAVLKKEDNSFSINDRLTPFSERERIVETQKILSGDILPY